MKITTTSIANFLWFELSPEMLGFVPGDSAYVIVKLRNSFRPGWCCRIVRQGRSKAIHSEMGEEISMVVLALYRGECVLY
jgi:hypothetical protein